MYCILYSSVFPSKLSPTCFFFPLFLLHSTTSLLSFLNPLISYFFNLIYFYSPFPTSLLSFFFEFFILFLFRSLQFSIFYLFRDILDATLNLPFYSPVPVLSTLSPFLFLFTSPTLLNQRTEQFPFNSSLTNSSLIFPFLSVLLFFTF
jgi:hypothetical protein